MVEAADAIRRREVSPVELADAYLERIELIDPLVNAFTVVTNDRAHHDARRAADELERGIDRGPLHGIPIALKDLIDTEAIQTAGGAEVYRDRVPERDATVAARLREAGAILLGKTNTHELAFGVTTTNPHFGATRNPWDLARIPGGSSGGSAAAIVARLAAATIGTDTGGSVRIPAALCGCVGLKATYGLVPKDGVLPLSLQLDCVGPITRTVEDCALVLDAIAGYEPADPTTLPVTPGEHRATVGGGGAGLRVGVPRSTMWHRLDPEVGVVAQQALTDLGDLGADIVDVELPDHAPIVGAPGSPGLFSLVIAESRHAHREVWSTRPDAFGPDLAARYSLPPEPAEAVIAALDDIHRYAAAVRQKLTEVDLLAAPTVPIVAPLIDTSTVTLGGSELPLAAAAIANTIPWSIARIPALSLPCGFSSDGLPIGLQLAGPPLGESTVLRVAHAYEQATRWHLEKPDMRSV